VIVKEKLLDEVLGNLPKYKAWHLIEKRMYSGEELENANFTIKPNGKGFTEDTKVSSNSLVVNKTRNMIPLQYIGRLDPERVELYHGDIVEAYIPNYRVKGSPYQVLRGWISKGPGGFRLDGPIFDMGGIDNAYYGPLRKVGTIFENSDLLEEKCLRQTVEPL